MNVKTIAKTCEACPSQWEGHLEDGRMFYARYRWGRLTVAVSDEPTDNVFVAADGELVVDVMLGDEYDGSLGYSELHRQMILAGFTFGRGAREQPEKWIEYFKECGEIAARFEAEGREINAPIFVVKPKEDE